MTLKFTWPLEKVHNLHVLNWESDHILTILQVQHMYSGNDIDIESLNVKQSKTDLSHGEPLRNCRQKDYQEKYIPHKYYFIINLCKIIVYIFVKQNSSK